MKDSFFIAILAAFCFGVGPIFAKGGLTTVSPLVGLTFRNFIVTIVLTATLVSTGSLKDLLSVTPKGMLLISLEGILAGLIGHWLYFKALKLGAASKVVPVVSVYPLFALLFAVVLLGEKPTLQKTTGVVLVVLGAMLLR